MYRGVTVEIPLNVGGLHGAPLAVQIPPTHLAKALNCTFENGMLQKEGGATKYNATPITGALPIIAGHDWWPLAANQRMIVYTGDSLLRDAGDGSFSTTLASGLTHSDTCVFVEGGQEAAARNKKLFAFTGRNQVKVLAGDGLTVTGIASPPTDWTADFPSFGAIHEDGRLWAGGNLNDPHRLYFSSPTSHEEFLPLNGGGSLSIYPGEGQRLVAAVSFKGLLVAWKYPRGIYTVDTSNPDPVNWRVRRHTPAVGSGSPQAILVVEEDVIFPDQVGHLRQLSAVQEFGSIGSRSLSDLDKMNVFMRRQFNIPAHLAKLRAVYYSRKREVHFAVPTTGSSTMDRRLVLDFNGPAARWRVSDRDVASAMWLRLDRTQNEQLVAGDNAGTVWLLDQSAKNKGGAGYTAEIATSALDFAYLDPSLATKNKIGQFLELMLDPTGGGNVEVDVLWDNIKRDTINYAHGGTGAKIGAFVLGTDALAAPAVRASRRRLDGSGKHLQLVFRNNNADLDFSIASAYVSFKVGDERETLPPV